MSKNKSKAATRKDVAELAGVSPPAVSLILNKNPGLQFSKATRQRVFEAAEKLNYRSSPIARALVSGRTMNIGICLHYISNPFNDFVSNILNGFCISPKAQDYKICITFGNPEQSLGGMFRERSVDGIAVLAVPYLSDDSELKGALPANFPVVFIGARPKKYAVNYVDVDNYGIAKHATEVLIQNGHRKIIHLAGPLQENSSSVDRLKGYEDALKQAGIKKDPRLIHNASYNYKLARKAMAKIIDAGLEFTAIFAANHIMGLAAQDILHEHGKKVPDDVSISTIDKLMQTPPSNGITLYHTGLPLEDIGKATFELLLERIKNPDSPCKEILLPGSDFVGDSVAPAPNTSS